MSEFLLEQLKTNRLRQSGLSPDKMFAQIEATKELVAAAHDQLVSHQIDRDAGSDWSPQARRYDAFFSIPEADAVMEISSVGLPSEVRGNGLFVYIYKKDQIGLSHQIVGLQTAKSPHLVDREEAFWLSGYTPDQLKTLSQIIKTAKSIDKATYDEFVKPIQSVHSKDSGSLIL